MIYSKRPRVSIVIPVYNEAAQLGACLEAIACQAVTPYEVVVVDNNSTDNTVAVAGRYGFVKIVRESKQGVLHARTRGFDTVRGDIIARIDADSLLPVDWVASVQAVFDDPSVDAVSGVALYYNVAAARLFNAIDLFFRRRLSRQLEGRVFLWGANMAMRRKAWQQVKTSLCNKSGIHEDYDIAIHLQRQGGRVTFDERLRVRVSSRRIDVGYRSFMSYVCVSPRTYAQHKVNGYWHMYPVVLVCALGYLPARALHRGYDVEQDCFKWSKVLAPASAIPRVDPTANVA